VVEGPEQLVPEVDRRKYVSEMRNKSNLGTTAFADSSCLLAGVLVTPITWWPVASCHEMPRDSWHRSPGEPPTLSHEPSWSRYSTPAGSAAGVSCLGAWGRRF